MADELSNPCALSARPSRRGFCLAAASLVMGRARAGERHAFTRIVGVLETTGGGAANLRTKPVARWVGRASEAWTRTLATTLPFDGSHRAYAQIHDALTEAAHARRILWGVTRHADFVLMRALARDCGLRQAAAGLQDKHIQEALRDCAAFGNRPPGGFWLFADAPRRLTASL